MYNNKSTTSSQFVKDLMYNKISINNKNRTNGNGLQRRSNYGIKTMSWENKLTELHWHLHSCIIPLISWLMTLQKPAP